MIRALALLITLWTTSALAFEPFAAAGIDQRLDPRVPLGSTFRDQSNAPVTIAAIAGGKPILLVPVLHKCPNICGVTLSGLAQAIAAQKFRPGPDFILVAFGIDPKEGPAEASASLADLRRFHARLPVTGIYALTGAEADLKAVTTALGYRYAWDDGIGQYAHVAATAVLTPDGRLSRWLYGLAPDPTDLKLALTEAGQGAIGRWTDQLLLLCYHYDPKTGRYGPAIWMALRTVSAATAAIIIGLIGFALLRERRASKRGGP